MVHACKNMLSGEHKVAPGSPCFLFISSIGIGIGISTSISHATKLQKYSHMQRRTDQHVKTRKKLASGPVGLEALLALPPPDGFLGMPPGVVVA